MAEEIAFENGMICNCQGLVTLTLTLDRVILHTVVHYSSTSTYTPNFIEMEETYCGRTDVHTDGQTHWRLTPTLSGRLRRVDLEREQSLFPQESGDGLRTNEDFFTGWANAPSFFQCSDTAGWWQEWNSAGKIRLLIPQTFSSEKGVSRQPTRFTCKVTATMDVASLMIGPRTW